MRLTILAITLLALAPATFAQTYPPGSTAGSGSVGGTAYPSRPAPPPQSAISGQPDPENCGTPDQPRACPPLPRKALQTYPANRQ
jgi:hypothetical protein